MTYAFTVLMDLHEGEDKPSALRVARALETAIYHTLDVDVAGAEVLDARWGMVTVEPVTEVAS